MRVKTDKGKLTNKQIEYNRVEISEQKHVKIENPRFQEEQVPGSNFQGCSRGSRGGPEGVPGSSRGPFWGPGADLEE